jgi:hypothetical protein
VAAGTARITPDRLAADSPYGSATTLNWIVNENNIVQHE